jgi:predicted AAA+ superfamily ATPase
VKYKLHTREQLVYYYSDVEMYNGKIEVVSFVIKSGRKLVVIGVKFQGKHQEMRQRKVLLLFRLYQVTMDFSYIKNARKITVIKQGEHLSI